jgi:hypothetical protein
MTEGISTSSSSSSSTQLLAISLNICANDGATAIFNQHVYKNNAAGSIGRRSRASNGRSTPPEEQEWHRSGSCPGGTIPIRRLPNTTINPNLTIIPELSVSSHGNIVTQDDSNARRAEVRSP